MSPRNFLACFFIFISFAAFSQVPAGSIAKYRLDSDATDYAGTGYNGTLTGVTPTTNRFGTAGTASDFVAGVSSGTLPAALVIATQNDFTFGFWFRTAMTAATGAQWYSGNSLVDAEVCGATTDWGTALIDGGKVAFGLGSSDFTIKSAASGYNNNAWHFVTVTRNRSSGAIVLYVDGTQVASATTANTASLSSPTLIGLGRNPCVASGVYTGSLDDLIAFNRVLTPTEVSNMYVALNAVALPVKWLSFTAESNAGGVQLAWSVAESIDNDHYEIEHATDGIHFSTVASVANTTSASPGTGTETYTHTIAQPASGIHFYRIRQIDKNGAYTFSGTAKITIRTSNAGLSLQKNPVVNELILTNAGQQTVQRLQITDLAGRIMLTRVINNNGSTIVLPVSALRPGYYLLQVNTVNGSSTLPFIAK